MIYKNDQGYDCVTTELITSVENLSKNAGSLKLYPNPTSENLFIESIKIVHNVYVTDIYGKVVYQNSPGKNQFSVSLSNLSKGFYFIRIDDQVQKVIKE